MVHQTISELPLISAVTVLPSTEISLAEHEMLQNGTQEVFVTTESERVLGLVPDFEFLKHRITPIDPHWTVSSIMSPITMSLPSSTLIEVAARQLRSYLWSRIAIIDDNHLTGILTRTAILLALSDSPISSASTETEKTSEAEAIVPENASLEIPGPKFLERQRASHRSRRNQF